MNQLPQTCVDVESALPLYVGADLERAEMVAVGEHIEGCAPCRRGAERARAARKALAALGDASATEGGDVWRGDLWPGIRERLVAEHILGPATWGAGGARRLLGTRWRRLAGLSSLAVAASLLALGLSGVFTSAPAPAESPLVAGPRGAHPLAADPVAATAGAVLAPTQPIAIVDGAADVPPVVAAPPGGVPGRLRKARPGEPHMLDRAQDLRPEYGLITRRPNSLASFPKRQ